MRSAAGPGVKVRLHEPQRQSWTISSFFLRTPLRVMAWLPQCGQASGGLFVYGALAGRRGERDIQEVSAEPITGVGFWKVRSRILEGCAVGRGRVQVMHFGEERRRILEGEEVSDFVSVGSKKMSGWAAGSVLVARGLGMLVSLLPMRLGGDGLER